MIYLLIEKKKKKSTKYKFDGLAFEIFPEFTLRLSYPVFLSFFLQSIRLDELEARRDRQHCRNARD